jgi:hypothetical protein
MTRCFTVVINETKRYDYENILVSEEDIHMLLLDHEQRGESSRWPLTPSDVNLFRFGENEARFKRAAELIGLRLHQISPYSATHVKFMNASVGAHKTN